MSASEDVKTLFRRFGGEAESYQEIVRDSQAKQSLNKWAMLGQIELNRLEIIPSANRSLKTTATHAVAAPVQRQPSKEPIHSTIHSTHNEALVLPIESKKATDIVEAVSPLPVQFESIAAALVPAKQEASVLHFPETTETVLVAVASKPVENELDVVANSAPSPALIISSKTQLTQSSELPDQKVTSQGHTLSRLFDRLSEPKTQNPTSSVLRRKYTK